MRFVEVMARSSQFLSSMNRTFLVWTRDEFGGGQHPTIAEFDSLNPQSAFHKGMVLL
jgi:hypothetical protein